MECKSDFPEENERAVNIIQSYWPVLLFSVLPNVSKQMAHPSAIGSKQKALNRTSKLMEQTWFIFGWALQLKALAMKPPKGNMAV